ncbi:unnamed protein product [Amoebophrya sp. A25]|nr:unnamed protein product [Amoebophrya sp. A25]|eukprot:GSA25T00003624001.1
MKKKPNQRKYRKKERAQAPARRKDAPLEGETGDEDGAESEAVEEAPRGMREAETSEDEDGDAEENENADADENESGENGDTPETDDEGTDGYRKGGYHQVKVGEIYNGKYKVIAKLGWGHFSTVWLVQDSEIQSFLAMKVQKSAAHYTEAAFDEIELLADAAKHASDKGWGHSMQSIADCLGHQFGEGHTGVVQLIDYFEHHGPNGRHVCMVFEPMGPNVLAVIKRYQFKGVPIDLVRKITAHTLIGLDYLHRVCGIIHTDLKPENVLVQCPHGIPVDKTGQPLIAADMIRKNKTKLFLENDSLSYKNLSKSQKRRLRAKEKKAEEANAQTVERKILEPPPYVKGMLKPSRSDPTLLSSYAEAENLMVRAPYHHHLAQLCQPKPAADTKKVPKDKRNDKHLSTPDPEEIREKCELVKGLDLFLHDDVVYKVVDLGNACWTHTHFSDDIQTRQYRSPEVMIGSGYDTSSDIWSLACMTFELLTGDYLFDPKPSDEYPRDEDHLALCVELLGKIPTEMIQKGRNGRTYFNRAGDLRHIKTLRYWGIEEVLNQKYNVNIMEARNLASFLIPMLQLSPSERVNAEQHLSHPWLRGLPSPMLDAHFPPNPVRPGMTGQEKLAYQDQEEFRKQAFLLQAEERRNAVDAGGSAQGFLPLGEGATTTTVEQSAEVAVTSLMQAEKSSSSLAGGALGGPEVEQEVEE